MFIKDQGNRSNVIFAILPILLIAMVTLRAFAQFESATLTGVVTDPANAVVPGADVRAVNIDTNQETAATTNSEGRYTFTNLRPGSYRVGAKAAGFKEAVSSGVVLQINQAARLNFELTVGQLSDEVQVTESVAILQTETSGLGAVIDHTKMVELPLNGRDYNQLALLSPGVLAPTPRLQSIGFRGAFNVNGNRAFQNAFQLDGLGQHILFEQLPGVEYASHSTFCRGASGVQDTDERILRRIRPQRRRTR
jgi:hypothetical protein